MTGLKEAVHFAKGRDPINEPRGPLRGGNGMWIVVLAIMQL